MIFESNDNSYHDGTNTFFQCFFRKRHFNVEKTSLIKFSFLQHFAIYASQSAWCFFIIILQISYARPDLPKQPLADVFKIGASKNFAIFKGKQLSLSLFLIKLEALRSAQPPTQVFFCEYCQIFKNSFFI